MHFNKGLSRMSSIRTKIKNNQSQSIYLPELLKEVQSLESRDEKIELLRLYRDSNQANKTLITTFVECLLHPAIVLDLPDEVPEYKYNDSPDYEFAYPLIRALKRIPYFVKGHQLYIENKLKREQLFYRTLEDLYKDDALLFERILISRKPDYSLDEIMLWLDAFPELFPVDFVTTQKQRYENETKK